MRIPFLTNSADLLTQGLLLHIDQVNWPETYPYAPKTEVRLAHNETHLFIRWDVEEDYILGRYTEDNTPVYKDSCVEAFIELTQDKPYYINFEFNCLGAMRASRRYSRTEVIGSLTTEEMQSIQRYPSLSTEHIPAAGHWSLMVVIPFALFNVSNINHSTLHCQFYKCGDETAHPHYLSWRPIHTPKPDFHHPEYFGELTFFSKNL